MKKIFTFCVLLLMATAVTNAATHITSKADTVRKKIVHPTQAMPQDQLNDILNSMRQKRTDDEKVVSLKMGVKDKGITIDQLITLLNQFLTDDAKITCAEYAFPYTTNYKQFLRIMDLFSQEQYKYKLEDFYDKNRK